jgi:putative transposase
MCYNINTPKEAPEVTTRGVNYERLEKFRTYQVGMQVPYCICPKIPGKILYGKIRSRIGEILKDLCHHKDVTIPGGHTMPDHIHMCVSIPPKYDVAMVMGYFKGKNAIRIHREIMGVNRGFTNKIFWIRGYCVSTVGLKIQEGSVTGTVISYRHGITADKTHSVP